MPVDWGLYASARDRDEAEAFGSTDRIKRGVDTPGLAENLHGTLGTSGPETCLARSPEEGLDIGHPIRPRHGPMREDFAIVAVAHETQLTNSPFQHAISSVSRHHRSFEAPQLIRPVCARPFRRRSGRGRVHALSSIPRRIRLRLSATGNERLVIAATRRWP